MQRAFADYYIQFKNARKAAIAAGYSEQTAQVQGSDLLRHPEVKEYLDKVFKERTMSSLEVLDALAEISRLDLSDIINPDGSINIVRMKELGIDRYVEEIGFDSNGFPKIKFMSKMQALALVGKAHKMFGESNQISGPGGGPVDMRVLFVRPSDVTQSSIEGAPESAQLSSGDSVVEALTPPRVGDKVP